MHYAPWHGSRTPQCPTTPRHPMHLPHRVPSGAFFLTPGIAVGIWDCLTPSDRTAFQATEWWNHSDLRWFTQGLGVVPASDSDSASVETSENEARQLNRPRRAG